jgi:hypothetical protein
MLSSRKCCCLSSARLPWRRSCMQACILASTLQVFRRKCPLDERKTRQREPAPLTFLVRMHPDVRCDLALAGELARASANPACYDCNPILVGSAGAFRELRTYTSSGVLMNSLLSFPRVEHLCKSRFRNLCGLRVPCRFICATGRLCGNGKCANHDNRSRRGGEMLPN